MTTLYLLRHSKPFSANHDLDRDSFQMQNEKTCLCIEGEQIAREKLSHPELENLDAVYASGYVRAIQTAKYLAEKQDLEIRIATGLGERKFGIASWNEKPDGFEKRQFLDDLYKVGDGESQKEVRERMLAAVMKMVADHQGKRIAAVSHGTAIAFLLKKWCDVEIKDDTLIYSYHGKEILNRSFGFCATIKLVFDENSTLVHMEKIQ